MEDKEVLEEEINKLTAFLDELSEKIEKCVNNIGNNVLGNIVEHKTFGKGKVNQLENNIIQVEFKNNVIKKFKIPDVFIDRFIVTDKIQQENIDNIVSLKHQKDNTIKEIDNIKKVLDELINENKIDVQSILCKEAKKCIEQGYISVDEDVEFRTIRDVSDLFNKHYVGFQRSWIKIDNNWQRVASCFQIDRLSDRNIYSNILSPDGNCFYYIINEESDSKKEEAVNGIINHEMEVTYLFLKYPDSGYKFYGIFKKDIDAMKKSIENKEYKVIYKKIDDKLDLTQFFNIVKGDNKNE